MNSKNIITSFLLISSLILTGCSSKNDISSTAYKETKQTQIVRCAECKNEMKETTGYIYICTNPSCKNFDDQQEEEETDKKKEVAKETKKESKKEDDSTVVKEHLEVPCSVCGTMLDAYNTSEAELKDTKCVACWEKEQEELECTNNDKTCPIKEAHEHANKKCIHCNELDFPTNFIDDPTGKTCNTCYSKGKICSSCKLWKDYGQYKANDVASCSDCLYAEYPCDYCRKPIGNKPCEMVSGVERYHIDCYDKMIESEDEGDAGAIIYCYNCNKPIEGEIHVWPHDSMSYCSICIDELQAGVHPNIEESSINE